DLRIGVIATNTMLAGAAGGITAMLYVWRKYGKPDPSMLANGTLAGLVAITAPCAFVTAPSAVLIGGVAGVLVCAAVLFIERSLKIDDPVGAISVHGVCGLWGILSVGLLADGTYGAGWNGVDGAVRGLFYGDASQFVAQLVGGVTNFVAVGAMAFVAWKVTGLVVGGHRVSAEIEELGLDVPEMGVEGYPHTPEAATVVVMEEQSVTVLDKPYDPAKRSAGFHTEVLFGQNATVIKSGGGALDLGTQADIPHLYVILNLPTASGSGLQFKAGRIPTLLGLEVIETATNPNWSEGNQFIYVEN